MALNGIIIVSYVIDIHNYTVIDYSWGIGKLGCSNYGRHFIYA